MTNQEKYEAIQNQLKPLDMMQPELSELMQYAEDNKLDVEQWEIAKLRTRLTVWREFKCE